jgi:hypothetical protein
MLAGSPYCLNVLRSSACKKWSQDILPRKGLHSNLRIISLLGGWFNFALDLDATAGRTR